MDIQRLLPINQYNAALSANAPTGANPFATILDLAGLGSQTLAQTLAVGKVSGGNDIEMSNDDIIKAVSGPAVLNMRSSSTDGDIYLGNGLQYVAMDLSFGMIASDGVYFGADNTVSQFNLQKDIGPRLLLLKSDFTKTGVLGVYDNDISAATSFNGDNYPSIISSRNASIPIGVVNSTVNGGDAIIAKTNNTAYVNQVGFNTGLSGEMILVHTPEAVNNYVATLQAKSGTIAYLSDVASLYAVDDTIGAGRIATLTDTLTFTGGETKFIGAGNTSATNVLFVENSDNDVLFRQDNSGRFSIGLNGAQQYGSVPTIAVGKSNSGMGILGAPAVGNNVVGDNVTLFFGIRDSGGSIATHSIIQHYVKSVTPGNVWSRQVINGGLHTQNSAPNTSRTLITNQPDFFGNIQGVLQVRNSNVASTTSVIMCDSHRQDALSSSLIVRSSGNGTSANTFNWNLRTDHFFTHNIDQLSTGDFTLRGFTDVSTFVMDASADRVHIGAATGASKFTVSGGDIEVVGQNNGLIVKDRTANVRWRIYIDLNGVLHTELA